MMKTLERSQSGSVLLEALIGILIFSLGILSMVALGATAVNVQADAQYRTEAMNLAERILSQIWTGVDRTQETINGVVMSVVSASSLNNYQHFSSGDNCVFTGSASTMPAVVDWVATLLPTDKPSPLPGSTAGRQQIKVVPANNNQVSITICWQTPSDNKVRHYTLVSYVN
ncbi:hypothetical protein [Accumulibacter sp.]|uniref:hypothetical protein n=1 Tax=Accumulibacter sp. TaxID=2053492 RepID=UPI001A3BCFFE|nr:hypothetical protein [Accumulibacter sp.]MBL8401177.1 hypothetical protein [Accumulibacter sp.]